MGSRNHRKSPINSFDNSRNLCLGSLVPSYYTRPCSVPHPCFMSDRNLRSNPKVYTKDYSVLHNTGDRVYTKRLPVEPAMDLRAKQIREKQLSDDLTECYLLFSLADLETPEEIREGIDSIGDLGKDLRHLHIELKEEMGDETHTNAYPKFDEQVKQIREYVTEGRKKLKALTKVESIAVEIDGAEAVARKNWKEIAQEELERENKAAELRVRNTILIEENVFREKLKPEIEDFEQDDIPSIEKSCSRFESLLDEYFKLLSRAKIAFEGDFETECRAIFEETIKDIRKQIKIGKSRVIELTTIQKEQLAEAEREKEEEAAEALRKEQMSRAKILSQEIEARSSSLVEKCDFVKLADFDDFKILECSKNLPSIDNEMREILSKFTEFSQIAAVHSDDSDSLVVKICRIKENSLKCRNSYAMKLCELISERDISEEKLKKSSSITIELQKFKGYDSKLDIYSFRSEFEKLVEKTVQKSYWLDTLKKNYLSGPALVLVERIEDIDEVWKKLISSYGNVKLLLQKKMSCLDKLESLDKLKGDDKIILALSKLINTMIELSNLAQKHNLECKLYIGGGIEKVFCLIGSHLERKFLSRHLDDDQSSATTDWRESEVETEKRVWNNLLAFLKKELSVREKMALVEKSKVSLGLSKSKQGGDGYVAGPVNFGDSDVRCHICGKSGHVLSVDPKGEVHCDYVSCKLFADWSCKRRRSELYKRKFCFQCLSPGVKHFEAHSCSAKYVCPDNAHKSHDKGIHVLVCHEHKDSQANLNLLQQYIKNFIEKRGSFEPFTKNISLMCTFHNVVAEHQLFKHLKNVIPDNHDRAIFPLQTINVDGLRIRIFYDRGAGDAVIRWAAILSLKKLKRAELIRPGPIPISGVSDMKSVSDHGVYSVCLPLKNGANFTITGICMDKVTAKLPDYDLTGVEKDVHEICRKEGGDELVQRLPKLASKVGGETDILLGSKYLKIHPKEVWSSEESGLSVAVSSFFSEDGSTGVINGPHPLFTEMEEKHWRSEGHVALSYYTDAVIAYRAAYKFSTDESPFGEKCDFNFPEKETCGLQQKCLIDSNGSYVAKRPPQCVKTFDEIDKAGTEVSFRCIDCRGCDKCKKSERVDAISFEEEVHQHIIEKNVVVNLEEGKATATLPFVTDPDVRINSAAQEKLALKIYESQVKALNNKPDQKNAAILSESKLQELGYVDYLHNLPQEIQDFISKNVRYFIPWRPVFNQNSVSTPCRLVFDASASPRGLPSLNSLLSKGRNNMNSLVMIVLRWFCYLYAFHTDISKMYNTIYLDSKHWRYQLYFWEGELKMGIAPQPKVVKSIIYGVRPSGNIAECALRRTAELTKSDYPKAYDIIMKDVYVDDCLSGKNSEEERSIATNQFSLALTKANFKLKGITYSGSHPPEHLANEDGISVTVGGLVWFPKEDTIRLKIPVPDEVRRKKFVKVLENFLEKLKRRDCVSIVYEIFDPSGKVAALVGSFKIDLHELVIRNLDWDDVIPENLRQIWSSNFEMIQELRNVRYKRAVVPEDAVDLNLETLDFADASLSMICIAIYVRFKRKSGTYSCQLLFSRTRTVPKDMTLPRAELLAASDNASTGHVVKTALGDRHKKAWKFTDSQVTLHWIHCFRTKLKMFVRNLVINIHRLSMLDDWRHVDSDNMIADLGTRRGVTLSDVGPDSPWINGHDWMRLDSSEFPVKTIADIKLSNENKKVAQKEEVLIDPLDCHVACTSFFPVVPVIVKDRYKYSQYILDPNKFRFRKVVRVLSWVFLFIRKCLRKVGKQLTQISNDYGKSTETFVYPEGKHVVTRSGKTTKSPKCQDGLMVELSATALNDALHYYFVKATLEVKHFLPKSAYVNISQEKQGVLYYIGRILPTQQIGGDLTLCDVSLDLIKSSFCVPIIDRHSPVAYSIVNEVHWYHPDVWHAGVESALRMVNGLAYVIGGRGLVRLMKDSCTKCRQLWKEEVKVAMGPKDASNLCIAPAFYNTQVDIVGPFESHSNANKRAKLKIWFCVFCCSTTGAVDCRIMDDYSTEAFVLAFIRFACTFGYPGHLYPDAGSQLLKGCKDMRISFSDLSYKLSVEFGVEFHPCPVGSHYYHGKVERKIREFRKSVEKELQNQHLSLIQWETLGHQISNSMNNLPIGLGNKCASLENLDLLTPNRLILGRNNSRCPTAPLVLSSDVRKIIQSNADIFNVWFQSWLVSYVPTLVPQPKWFQTTRNISVGDVVLFSKSDKEFENIYQYGIVKATHVSRDGLVRSVDVEYQNPSESTKRVTNRGVRELVVIHPYDELGLSKELYDLAAEAEQEVNVCCC